MPLTDQQKEEAKRLGLSQQEARFSLATRIPLARYAEIKAQIAEEGAARQAQEVAGNEVTMQRATYFKDLVRGADRPGLDPEMFPPEADEDSFEDGG